MRGLRMFGGKRGRGPGNKTADKRGSKDGIKSFQGAAGQAKSGAELMDEPRKSGKKSGSIADRMKVIIAKEALEYAEKIVDTVREPLIVLDVNLKVISANKSFYRTFKVDPKETQGRFIFDLGNRQWNIPKLRQLLEKILPKNNPFENFEIEHDFETIGKKTMLLNARRLDTVQMILLAIEDITERKKFEEAESIRVSEERYRNIFEMAPDGIITSDTKGVITSCNAAFVKLMGYPKDEIIGKHFSKLPTLSAKDNPKYIELVSSVLMGKTPDKPPEITWTRKDGTRCFGDFSLSLIKKGRSISGIQAVLRDITERKKADEALKTSEERFRMIFEYAPDAYYLNDLRGNFVDGNIAAEKLTGYKRDELVGKSFLKLRLLPADQIPKAAALLVRNAIGHSTGPDEFKLLRRDGTEVPVEIRTYPVEIAGKKTVLGIAHDITNRKRLEEETKRRYDEMAKLKEELERKVEEFERLNRLAVGRELKMIELKKRIEELERGRKTKSVNV